MARDLTPRPHSSDGKERLGGTTKQGDGYLRRLLVIGATAVMRMGLQRTIVSELSLKFCANPVVDFLLGPDRNMAADGARTREFTLAHPSIDR